MPLSETKTHTRDQHSSSPHRPLAGTSPSPNMAAADISASSWTGQPRIRGSTESMRLFLLTFSLIGLQFCWGTEQTYATPYLLALGLSKGGMSLVWIAGPLSGLIMQPIIGMISDKSTSRWGRRRPVSGTTSWGKRRGSAGVEKHF